METSTTILFLLLNLFFEVASSQIVPPPPIPHICPDIERMCPGTDYFCGGCYHCTNSTTKLCCLETLNHHFCLNTTRIHRAAGRWLQLDRELGIGSWKCKAWTMACPMWLLFILYKWSALDIFLSLLQSHPAGIDPQDQNSSAVLAKATQKSHGDDQIALRPRPARVTPASR